MSSLSFLKHLSSQLTLSPAEKAKIRLSTVALGNRLESHFGDALRDHFVFGSFSRDTILPRWADENSDVDYMVLLDNSDNYKPQTYMNWLRTFVTNLYTRSEIYQDHPTIVLELSHIKFELVPSYLRSAFLFFVSESIMIPARASDYQDWQETDPTDFNQRLTDLNKRHKYLIKPLIRLVKYWNALNGYPFESYSLEKDIIQMSFWDCKNLRDYFYQWGNSLDYSTFQPQWVQDAISNALELIESAEEFDDSGDTSQAERLIRSLYRY